ncbi:MAG: adenylate/guanylate cyclase domain-containing protein, partial [Pseudomonadota bacterium]
MSPLPGVVTGLFRDNEQLESLPPMARARLQEQENAAEVLTRVIQLGIVLFFSVLYITSPKLGAPDKQFITPLILLLYVALTAFGLIWSIRKPLPDWAVYGSTIIDMALLYALIWTFHIIYEQPPSFYLKAPTLLYVFIFITLRALRFQARFVIASGVTAAVGWGLMFMYVLVFDKFNEMVTRDFVTYLTSNSILIGAEVDKIISILVVTAILALSISRARQTLIRAITEQHAASNLSRFFDEDVAGEITANDIDLDNESGVERSAAILNIDLRGFSKLAETHEPNEVIALLTAYQKRVVPIIKKHGGSIDKFLGDGILASFGA